MNVFVTDCVFMIDEHEDDEQRERDDDREPLFRGLEILELPRPLDVIAGRKLHALAHALARRART